jgi:hypothetical protein
VVGATLKHNSERFEDSRTPPLLHHRDTVIMDSGCTENFLLIHYHCRNKTKYINPLRARLQNGAPMDSTRTASLYIPELSEAASVAHVFPAMENNSFLSVGQSCNEVYYV